MPKFLVNVREVYTQMVLVEADNTDEAKTKVAKGDGTYLDNTLEYSHTLDQALWTVDESLSEDPSNKMNKLVGDVKVDTDESINECRCEDGCCKDCCDEDCWDENEDCCD